ncbi:MAG TPA: 5-methyltetrahydropteroyltriglutamate--homocysteine S-methyltransferase [Opitutaceae bacterium]|nr:5-methyltetrahydropteroyltriglutamate--homocysteine S-methyltransferase [Opitutaceae bacterium]
MNSRSLTHTLGYPRIGPGRELKKATEAYWQKQISLAELEAAGARLRRRAWETQRAAGIDLIPSNDFSFYDHVLDQSCLVGAVPARFGWRDGDLGLDWRFLIARGVAAAPGPGCGCAAAAGEMTKWFDTNYHYIVPEVGPATAFRLSARKVFDEFAEALALGIRTKPVLVGPVTWLLLSKPEAGAPAGFDPLALLDRLLPVYAEILRRLAEQGAEWVQLDEPVFALDLTEAQRAALARAYAALRAAAPGLQLLVASYFGELRGNLAAFADLPVAALHLDAVRGGAELGALLERLPAGRRLSLGVVDGRNIWRNDLDASLALLDRAREVLDADRLLVAPSCSLLHVPVAAARETALDPELRSWLSFAEEKLAEVEALRTLLAGTGGGPVLAASRAARASRQRSGRLRSPPVRARLAGVGPGDLRRASAFPQRQDAQQRRLGLPLFPTTTIGSFPQTAEIRAARARWKRGELAPSDYERFLEERTAECVRFQDEIGLDLPVHGEFERNDMVEYFGEQLEGYAFSAHGWVQSYGTRCVKPPILFGDVSRPRPMTVRWARYAQSLTRRPMKGMLTGPVTMLQWSFARDDQPRAETARQLALALRDEVLDLERAGIAAIQIDEPALREGLPLRQADRPAYLRWAVDAFRLSAAGVRDDTQIHTHMCYAEFNDIIAAIAELDADVITIETARSRLELLGAFAEFKYPNEIGPGVYDIHSPRVPAAEEMAELLRRARAVLPARNLWVNPDCGLKTRGWPEVRGALRHLVEAARRLRAEAASGN